MNKIIKGQRAFRERAFVYSHKRQVTEAVGGVL